MLLAEVSGKKNMRKTQQKPLSHINSQMVQVHPLAEAAKPPTSGPRVGPQMAAIPYIAIAYARFLGENMSASDAPPVANTGDPKKPVRKRNAKSMPMLTE